MRRPPRSLAWRIVGLALVLASGCDDGGEGSPAPSRLVAPSAEGETPRVELTEEAEARIGIVTAQVERRDVARSRTLPGETLAAPGLFVQVSAPFAGSVVAPASGTVPRVGTRLKPGAAVLRLIPLLPADGDLGVEAQRQLAAARARHEAARERASRAERMLEDRAGSVRSLEEARADLAVAGADLAAAQARSGRLARTSIDSEGGLVLLSPRDAVLQDVHVSEGQTVAAGTPLFEVVSPDPLWVRVRIYAGELGSVDPTRPASVRPLGAPPEAPALDATPVSGPASADLASSTADLFFEVPNPGGTLRIGQRMSVTLTLEGKAESLVVPASAILYDFQGGAWVYQEAERRAYRRSRVEVTAVVDGSALLARGPEPGSRVVTEGATELFGSEFGTGS